MWFLATKLGRTIALAAVLAMLAGLAYLAIYNSGKHSCQNAAISTEIKEVKISNEIKDLVAGHTASANRAGLQLWSRAQ